MPKKTVNEIIKSKNNYVIGVKGNQCNLLKQIKKTTTDKKKIIDISVVKERLKGRLVTRECFVSTDLSGISKDWIGLESIIRIERKVECNGNTTKETAYYISSLKIDAYGFNIGIQKHWGIENRLHWVKDVVFKEDSSKIKKGYAAENFSIIRNIVINIFRNNGKKSIKSAIRRHSNDINYLRKLLE